MACFPYWTFVNRTTVDATWCHKIKSSEPWIFSSTFFSFIFFFIWLYVRVDFADLAAWKFPWSFTVTNLKAQELGKCVRPFGWLATIQSSAFTFRSKIINFSFAHAKMCSNFHKKKKPRLKNAIWNHLNNANWQLLLNSIQSAVASSKFKQPQSNSD